MSDEAMSLPALTGRQILDDPATSHRLKAVLLAWADRDIVDAANDAAVLLAVYQAELLARLERLK